MSTASRSSPQHPWFQNSTFKVSDSSTWPSVDEQKYVSQDAAAAQSVRETEEGGGSTYGLHTGTFVEPHWGDEPKPGKRDEFIVGGETVPSTTHRNPTVTLSQAQFGHEAVVNGIWNTMTVNATNDRAHFGTWREQPKLASGEPNPRAGLTDLDVSGRYLDEAQAVAIGDERQEREVFATNPGRTIETPHGARVRKDEGK